MRRRHTTRLSDGGRRWRRALVWALAVVLTLLSAVQVQQPPDVAFAADCAQLNAQAYQPLIGETADAFQRAGLNTMGSDYPPLPQVKSGVGNVTYVNAFIPCVVLKTIGLVESGWSQASGSVPRGQTGPALTGYSPTNCGYGIMQITSGMGYPGQMDPEVQRRIAQEYRYNVGWGAKMLADKWNWVGATMGDRNPTVAENWYFAVWAYNYWGYKNNPWNDGFKWPRPAYNPYDSTQQRTWYPYQELVWGWAAHPPDWGNGGALWWNPPVDLKLPNRDAIPLNVTDVGVTTNVPDPAGVHPDTCNPVPMGQVKVDRTQIAFLLSPGQTQSSPQTVTLSSTNGQPFSWQPSISVAWLNLTAMTPTGNVTTAQFRVSAVQPPAGRATGTLSVSASGSYLQSLAQQIPVSSYVGALQRAIFPLAGQYR